MKWIINPADYLRGFAKMVCYARGIEEVCLDVLSIAQDEDRNIGERLRELSNYGAIGYKPTKPLPQHPPYRPELRRSDVTEEYSLLTSCLGDEPMHGYVRGKCNCSSLIRNMSMEKDGRSEEDVLRGIVAFCRAVIDITGGERP